MKLSCGLAPNVDVVAHAKLAESLGYERVWVFDSPALYGDLWIALARVAEHTRRIGLGTGVLVPHTRHPLVTASAIATIEALSPGRLALAVGTGFTARMTMGQRPLAWSYVERYVRALRALLRGETAEWDGELVQMLHAAGQAPPRPIDVPILIGANGPKGLAIAREIGDGVMAAGAPQPGFAWSALLQMGTVLEAGETLHSARVVDAIGPAIAAMYHGAYEAGGAGVDQLPGGKGWREEIEAFPEAERHLRIHEGHVTDLTERDRRHLSPDLGAAFLVGEARQVRERLDGLAAAGATELMYVPIGDVERELRAMAGA
ncbi:MAG: LLM class flavin-dependent oxidoreductase, partial [Myxococcales bacterium]|nr:LLM class flavin-dependent oxidoreductase [Myxococcales bacterium]